MTGTSVIGAGFESGEGLTLGQFCVIGDNVRFGDNVTLGHHVVIEDDVVLGDNVKLGNHVVLKSGTRFGSHIDFADFCCTTGLSIVGNYVNVRTGAVVSKGVIIQDCAFIGPGVMTNHTKNVTHRRAHIAKDQYVTSIGYGSVVGSTVSMVAGLHMPANVFIGAGAVVVKPITEPGIYVGYPLKRLKDVPSSLALQVPDNYQEHRFDPALVERYLPAAMPNLLP